jgi:ribosomal-protein-alanine N-acetyltransferase
MLKTQRLTIRKFEPKDIDPLSDLFSSFNTMKFIGPRRVMTYDETENWLEDQLKRQQSEVTRRAVSLTESDELIGVCGFQYIDGKWDFGYYFRESFWGNGYATEACICLLSHVSEMIENVDFQIFIAAGNTRSKNMIERCGCIPILAGSNKDESGWFYKLVQQCGAPDALTHTGDLCR